MRSCALMRFYQPFPAAIPLYEAGYPRVTHPSATKFINLPSEDFRSTNSVRLACVRHAASVHPEPGSNSQFYIFLLLCSKNQTNRLFQAASLQTRLLLDSFSYDFRSKCENLKASNNHTTNYSLVQNYTDFSE